MICVIERARSGPRVERSFSALFRAGKFSRVKKESKREVGGYHFDWFPGFGRKRERPNYFFVTGGGYWGLAPEFRRGTQVALTGS